MIEVEIEVFITGLDTWIGFEVIAVEVIIEVAFATTVDVVIAVSAGSIARVEAIEVEVGLGKVKVVEAGVFGVEVTITVDGFSLTALCEGFDRFEFDAERFIIITESPSPSYCSKKGNSSGMMLLSSSGVNIS